MHPGLTLVVAALEELHNIITVPEVMVSPCLVAARCCCPPMLQSMQGHPPVISSFGKVGARLATGSRPGPASSQRGQVGLLPTLAEAPPQLCKLGSKPCCHLQPPAASPCALAVIIDWAYFRRARIVATMVAAASILDIIAAMKAGPM